MKSINTIRPTVFIGSSSEGHKIAEIIQIELDNTCEVTIWSQGIFELSQGTLESLMLALDKFDFAILILTPDDMIISRSTSIKSPRDNILFELGLFIGRLGRDRAFILYDRTKEIKIPTDLAGITAATFQEHSDGNLQAALGASCSQINNIIKKIGIREERLIDNKYEKANHGIIKFGTYGDKMISNFVKYAIPDAENTLINKGENTIRIDISGHSLWGNLRPEKWIKKNIVNTDMLRVLHESYTKYIDNLDLNGVLFRYLKKYKDKNAHKNQFSFRFLLLHPDSEQAILVFEKQKSSSNKAIEKWRNNRTDIYLSIYVLHRLHKTHKDWLNISEVCILPKEKWMSFSMIGINDNLLCAAYPCTQLLDQAPCMCIRNETNSIFSEYQERFNKIFDTPDNAWRINLDDLVYQNPSQFRDDIMNIISIEN